MKTLIKIKNRVARLALYAALAFSLQPSAFSQIITLTNTTPFPTVLSQMNYNFAWIAANAGIYPPGITNLILTNSGTISITGGTLILNTNGFGGGGSGGAGGAWTNNYLIKSFGAGNDLTISNSFTLVNTNITGYTLQSITVSGGGGTGSTTNMNGAYTYDSDLGALTNFLGYVYIIFGGGGGGGGVGSGIGGGGGSAGTIFTVPGNSTNDGVGYIYVNDNSLGASYLYFESENSYHGTDFGQNFYASYATSNWVFTCGFNTSNSPAVPANGSSYQLYTNGVAYFVATNAVQATFYIGGFIPQFNATASSSTGSSGWAILQPNGSGDYTIIAADPASPLAWAGTPAWTVGICGLSSDVAHNIGVGISNSITHRVVGTSPSCEIYPKILQ
jgi:hypothetical protein